MPSLTAYSFKRLHHGTRNDLVVGASSSGPYLASSRREHSGSQGETENVVLVDANP